jgi:small GTP-binding protein
LDRKLNTFESNSDRQIETLRESMGTVDRNVTDSLSSVIARISICERILEQLKSTSASQIETLRVGIAAVDRKITDSIQQPKSRPPDSSPASKPSVSSVRPSPSPVPRMAAASGNSDRALKFVLVGDSGVGKSQIVSQFTKHEFSDFPRAAFGAEFSGATICVHNHNVLLQLWDTPGQERFRSIAPAYYQGAIGALAVYDITSSDSFASIPGWLCGLRARAHPQIAIILIGNRADSGKLRAVSFEEGRSFAQSAHLLFIETSAKDATNISQAFEMLASEVIRRIEKGDLPEPTTAQSSRPKA